MAGLLGARPPCWWASLDSAVFVAGDASLTGTYLLHLRLGRPVRVTVRRGQPPEAFPAGFYVYVGSAMGSGSAGLAARLLRHASRSGERPPQRLRQRLERGLVEAGLMATAVAPRPKRLHWHIDRLLDARGVRLTAVTVLRGAVARERAVAELLVADPEAQIVVRGFGAGDHPGGTHLFLVPPSPAWQERLRERAAVLVGRPA